jgi:hypothetical protein
MIAAVELEAVNGGWGFWQSWRPFNAYANGTAGEGTNASANWAPPAPGTYRDNVQYPITDAEMRQLYEDYEPEKLSPQMEYGPMQYPAGEAPTLEPGVQAVARYNPDGSVYESYANPQAMYDANNGGEPNYDIDFNANSLQEARQYTAYQPPELEPGVQAVAQYNPDGSSFERYDSFDSMTAAVNGSQQPDYDIDFNASSLQDAQAYSDANQSGAQSFDTSGFENVDYGSSQDYSDYE